MATDKGFKYEGSNVFGAAYQATKQAVTTGGALNKAVDERSVSRRISKDKIKAAMKNLDEKGRDEAMKSIKSGKIKLGENGLFRRIGKNMKENLGLYTLGVASALKVVGVRENRKAYNDAKEQLLNEGRIDNLVIEAVRTSNEKEMIYKRMKVNKDASKVRAKTNSISDIASAKQAFDEANRYQKEDKDIKTGLGKFFVKMKREVISETQKIPFVGRSERIQNEKELKENWDGGIGKMHEEELRKEMDETIAKKAESNSRMNKWIGIAEDIKKSPEMEEMARLIDSHKNAVNKEEKRKAKDAIDEHTMRSDYVESLEKWQEANTNAIYHKHEADIHAYKEEKIKKSLDKKEKVRRDNGVPNNGPNSNSQK